MQRSNIIESQNDEEQSDDSCNAIEISKKLNSEKPMVRIKELCSLHWKLKQYTE